MKENYKKKDTKKRAVTYHQLKKFKGDKNTMEIVKELKQHVGGFSGRLIYLWDAIADLGYSSSSEYENMIIVYDDKNKQIARIETEYINNNDGVKVVSIF